MYEKGFGHELPTRRVPRRRPGTVGNYPVQPIGRERGAVTKKAPLVKCRQSGCSTGVRKKQLESGCRRQKTGLPGNLLRPISKKSTQKRASDLLAAPAESHVVETTSKASVHRQRSRLQIVQGKKVSPWPQEGEGRLQGFFVAGNFRKGGRRFTSCSVQRRRNCQLERYQPVSRANQAATTTAKQHGENVPPSGECPLRQQQPLTCRTQKQNVDPGRTGKGRSLARGQKGARTPVTGGREKDS